MLTIPDQTDIITSLPENHSARSVTERKGLLIKSRTAARRSYSPYSGFPVGAAIRTWRGTEHMGQNTETAISEGLNCGERSAILDAVTQGEHFHRRDFLQMIAISCINAPPPYTQTLGSKNGKHIEKAVDLAVQEQEKQPQTNFAGLTPGWLKNKFVLQALSDGSPCGACRQVMNDFSGSNTIVLIDDHKDGVLFRMSDLLPVGFRFGDTTQQDKPHIENVYHIEQQAHSNQISLIDAANLAAHNSYSWGTAHLKNGTAIRCTDGQIYIGSSMINSSTGLSINSMRSAVNRAISNGAIERCGTTFIQDIATSFTEKKHPLCIQHGIAQDLMIEFANQATIINIRIENEISRFSIGQLLSIPHRTPQ